MHTKRCNFGQVVCTVLLEAPTRTDGRTARVDVHVSKEWTWEG
jgi:hypothetical protein